MEFEVSLVAKYYKTIFVEAESYEEAEEKIDDMLRSGEIDITADFDDAQTIIQDIDQL